MAAGAAIVIWARNGFGSLSAAWSPLWPSLLLLSVHIPLPYQYPGSKSDYLCSESPQDRGIKFNLHTWTLEAPAIFPGCMFLLCLILMPWQILKDYVVSFHLLMWFLHSKDALIQILYPSKPSSKHLSEALQCGVFSFIAPKF